MSAPHSQSALFQWLRWRLFRNSFRVVDRLPGDFILAIRDPRLTAGICRRRDCSMPGSIGMRAWLTTVRRA